MVGLAGGPYNAPAAREIDEIRDELEGVDANGKHDAPSRLGQPQGGADEEESIFEEADWNVEPKLNRFKLMLTVGEQGIDGMKGMLRHGKRLVREYVYRTLRRRRANREQKGISASELMAPPGPTLIIAAHPDDEVIGAGALLSRLHCADVLHVTDGAPREGNFAQKAGFAGRSEYAAERQREAAAALALLGRDTVRVQCLGIPDQEATTNIASLAQRLAELLTDYSFVVTHAYEGGHPDHDATALSVQAACCLIKRGGCEPPSLLEMTGYHGWGGQNVRGVFIPHPDAGSVAELMLTWAERDLKRRMFACHATQRGRLKNFSLDVERFRSAPRYDFLAPPHRGELHYERFRWGILGQTWRCAAKQALAELDLLDRR